jgi:hypothetical protein
MPSKPRHRNAGSALTEWLIVALPLLLLGSLTIEVSGWHMARQRIALTTQRAVDATALNGGTPSALGEHLKRDWPQGLRVHLKACVTDPIADLMRDFSDPVLSQRLGQRVIRHDHLNQQRLAKGLRGGAGGGGRSSGKTLAQANQLNVEVTARYTPRSPWIRSIIKTVPIRLRAMAVMQSHRLSWRDPCVRIEP